MKTPHQHVHLLGICGTGMGSLAGLLCAKGYKVTGSDNQMYPPMSTQLTALGITTYASYDPKNLVTHPDLVIIGNVITKDNPEAVAVLEKRISYMSMPEAVAALLLPDKRSLVVAGTHGKTTTATILAWLLYKCDLDPSFLIGGVGLNFGVSYRLGSGKDFVLEGDEYDTAFFDKKAKFRHYRPNAAIIGPIEYDHADIYADLDHIKAAFAEFISLIPPAGNLVANADSEHLMSLVPQAHCETVSCGFAPQATYCISNLKEIAEGTAFVLRGKGNCYNFVSPLWGRHNLANVAQALSLGLELGLDGKELQLGLSEFRGVKRRQEIRGRVNDITVIDDFAHHPTAIAETIKATRARFPHARVWAVFEPRSHTSRRNVFATELAAALAAADFAIMPGIYLPEKIPAALRLDPEAVINTVQQLGSTAWFLPETEKIVQKIVELAAPKDVILVMSNGAFDNIHERLLAALKERTFT